MKVKRDAEVQKYFADERTNKDDVKEVKDATARAKAKFEVAQNAAKAVKQARKARDILEQKKKDAKKALKVAKVARDKDLTERRAALVQAQKMLN